MDERLLPPPATRPALHIGVHGGRLAWPGEADEAGDSARRPIPPAQLDPLEEAAIYLYEGRPDRGKLSLHRTTRNCAASTGICAGVAAAARNGVGEGFESRVQVEPCERKSRHAAACSLQACCGVRAEAQKGAVAEFTAAGLQRCMSGEVPSVFCGS